MTPDETLLYGILEEVFYAHLERWHRDLNFYEIGEISYPGISSLLEEKNINLQTRPLFELIDSLYAQEKIRLRGRINKDKIWVIEFEEKHEEAIKKKRDQIIALEGALERALKRYSLELESKKTHNFKVSVDTLQELMRRAGML